VPGETSRRVHRRVRRSRYDPGPSRSGGPASGGPGCRLGQDPGGARAACPAIRAASRVPASVDPGTAL